MLQPFDSVSRINAESLLFCENFILEGSVGSMV